MMYLKPDFRIEFRDHGLHAFCEKDNEIADITFEGYDPSLAKFRFKCRKCENEQQYKFYTPVWGLPPEAVSDAVAETSGGSGKPN